jgi:simple sugar transport system substrate-binding protein
MRNSPADAGMTNSPADAGMTEARLDRARLLRGAGVAALAAAGLPDAARAASASFLQPHPRWRFVFVNHATTNPFFIPARYGIADACSLYGVRGDWTGSRRSDVQEMVAAMRKAISERVAGIAVSLIDPHAFNEPTSKALSLGIPVVSYNADGGVGNQRLAYVGQDLYQAGLKFGARIVELVGRGDVYVFIATPGQANIQPRFDGAVDAVRDSGKPITLHIVATGADVGAEHRKIEATYLAHRRLRGMFAVDAGSTRGIAQVMSKHDLHERGVSAGGWDLLPGTLSSIADGRLDFTIDQQPYLQGFIPTLELFLYQASKHLSGIADVDTGLKFLTKTTVAPYNNTKSRYEGTSSKAGVS